MSGVGLLIFFCFLLFGSRCGKGTSNGNDNGNGNGNSMDQCFERWFSPLSICDMSMETSLFFSTLVFACASLVSGLNICVVLFFPLLVLYFSYVLRYSALSFYNSTSKIPLFYVHNIFSTFFALLPHFVSLLFITWLFLLVPFPLLGYDVIFFRSSNSIDQPFVRLTKKGRGGKSSRIGLQAIQTRKMEVQDRTRNKLRQIY